jgi:hypothetical protein
VPIWYETLPVSTVFLWRDLTSLEATINVAKEAIENFARDYGNELCERLLQGLVNTSFSGDRVSSTEFAAELQQYFNKNHASWGAPNEG